MGQISSSDRFPISDAVNKNQGDRDELQGGPSAAAASGKGLSPELEAEFLEMEAELSGAPNAVADSTPLQVNTTPAPLSLVETAFLASTASLLWLASYYLSLVPWMRILFPAPIALVYLRWGQRAAWMCMLVTGLLLSVLMGPYLSLLFLLPYGLLGVQLGALWKRQTPWMVSISIGTLIATISFFFRIWLLSIFLGEDLWVYLTDRIADFLEWIVTFLVDWGWLDIGILGQVNRPAVQLLTVGTLLLSDFVYLFTVHLVAWLLLPRLGNPIPDPPGWVRVLMEEP